MGLASLLEDMDDWCGTPLPGHPPRPPWLRDVLTAVILAELSTGIERTKDGRALYEAAASIYESVAEQVALNPQPLPPLE
jgi:hypothetical protein